MADNPYASPANELQDSRPQQAQSSTSFGRQFGVPFACAATYALGFYFATSLIPEPQHDFAFIAAIVGLLVGCFATAWFCSGFRRLLLVMSGITWGFLWSLSAAICIQNGDDSIGWSRFIPALVIAPIVLSLITWPVMRVSQRRAQAV